MPLIDLANPRARWAAATFGVTGVFLLLMAVWRLVIDGDASVATGVGVVIQALVFGALWGAYLYWRLRGELRSSRGARADR